MWGEPSTFINIAEGVVSCTTDQEENSLFGSWEIVTEETMLFKLFLHIFACLFTIKALC